MGFWEDVYELRTHALIPRLWSRGDIRTHLAGKYRPNTLNSLPSNQSMTKDGRVKGNYVLRGLEPRAWRIEPGVFELVDDPEDTNKDQQASREGMHYVGEVMRHQEEKEDLAAKPQRGANGGLQPWREQLVVCRMDDLCGSKFLAYVELGRHKYAGPSVYFHRKTVDRFQGLQSNIFQAAKDERFCELLYATLVSWGMHDMRAAKMPDFETFSDRLAKLSPQINDLSQYHLGTLSEDDLPTVRDRVWALILGLQGSATESSRLVANSKLLHHLLPRLIPPIDRANTGLFFGYENEADLQGLEKQERAFRFIFPWLNSIAQNVKNSLDGFTYAGFNSSPTKVIDNAIIGFVENEGLKKKKKENRAQGRARRSRVGRAV